MDGMTHKDDNTPNIPELPDALRNAARAYNTPPELKRADFDDMWSAIEAKAFKSDIGGRVTDDDSRSFASLRMTNAVALRWFAPRSLMQIAATLIIGVAIGRVSVRAPNVLPDVNVERRMSIIDTMRVPAPYRATTTRYLGQTAALLVALPADGTADTRFTGRAHNLLLTTRLLLDSPAASDARTRALLEDLELVLAQVVRLEKSGQQGHGDLDLIRQAMDSRDVMPRLRTAVADIAANN
jgi:hypothetical protein